jgi:hypothetical protein
MHVSVGIWTTFRPTPLYAAGCQSVLGVSEAVIVFLCVYAYVCVHMGLCHVCVYVAFVLVGACLNVGVHLMHTVTTHNYTNNHESAGMTRLCTNMTRT